jgi:diaminopimelate decarboxylase
MDYFHYNKGRLWCEDIPVADIVREFSTPLYIYSLKTFVRHLNVTSRAFGSIPHLVCYAAKANSALAVLRTAALCGAGADVVSGSELSLAVKAGIKPNRIVFSGVGKTEEEIELAVKTGILFICAESMDEIETIAKVSARHRMETPVAIRVNPDIDPKTHPHIATGLKETKFGLNEADSKKAYEICRARKWLNPVGISMHIGSQVETVRPYIDSVRKLVALFKYLLNQNIKLQYIDIGGGWAAHFERDAVLPHPDDYVSAVFGILKGVPATVVVEPGRSLVGNAGIIVMKVIRTKRNGPKEFCVVDAGMNDFIRPALYDAGHRIEPVKYVPGRKRKYDVVGPLCESSDRFAGDVRLPVMRSGDLLAMFTAGAYGSVMGSNYNSRLRPAEVAVAGKKVRLIRERQTSRDLVRGQHWRDMEIRMLEDLHA